MSDFSLTHFFIRRFVAYTPGFAVGLAAPRWRGQVFNAIFISECLKLLRDKLNIVRDDHMRNSITSQSGLQFRKDHRCACSQQVVYLPGIAEGVDGDVVISIMNGEQIEANLLPKGVTPWVRGQRLLPLPWGEGLADITTPLTAGHHGWAQASISPLASFWACYPCQGGMREGAGICRDTCWEVSPVVYPWKQYHLV